MENDGQSWRIRAAAAALVSPLILAPGIATAAMFWARYESIQLHPEAAAKRSPTISRAIADPRIGDPFAVWMLLVAALQAFAVYRIAQAMYRTVIVSTPPERRPYMTSLFIMILLCQASGVAGVITLSQYTGSISDYLHQLGSYLMFYGNGFSILFCGIFVWQDHKHRVHGADEPPIPYILRIHTRFAGVVTVVSLFFAFLFFAYTPLQAINDYVYRLFFAMCELVLLIASLIYLGSFIVPMYRHERYLLERRLPGREAMPAANEA